MGVCRSCKRHTNQSVCPHCGGTVVEKKSIFKRSSSSSSYSNNDYNEFGDRLDNMEKGCFGFISGKIKLFVYTYIFFIVVGIVLTYLLRQNKLDFVKEHYDILQFVRIFCLMLGWLPALGISALKRW